MLCKSVNYNEAINLLCNKPDWAREASSCVPLSCSPQQSPLTLKRLNRMCMWLIACISMFTTIVWNFQKIYSRYKYIWHHGCTKIGGVLVQTWYNLNILRVANKTVQGEMAISNIYTHFDILHTMSRHNCLHTKIIDTKNMTNTDASTATIYASSPTSQLDHVVINIIGMAIDVLTMCLMFGCLFELTSKLTFCNRHHCWYVLKFNFVNVWLNQWTNYSSCEKIIDLV